MAKPKKPKKNKNRRIELNAKEFKVNLEQLQKDVARAYDSMKKLVPHSLKNLEVKRFGNAAHIIVPKEFVGKKAAVFIKKN